MQTMDMMIKKLKQKLSKRHEYHMKRYGEGNEERMTGHETASYDKFSCTTGEQY